MSIKTIKYVLLLVVFVTFLMCTTMAYGDVITEIYYDNGLSVEKGEYFILNEHIRTVPSNSALKELSFGTSNSSVIDIYVDPNDGDIIIYGKKTGHTIINVYNDFFAEQIDFFVVYPRSGYELDFEPDKWSSDSVRTNRNCYLYAFDLWYPISYPLYSLYDEYFFQPGDITMKYIEANEYSYNGTIYNSSYTDATLKEYMESVRHDTRAITGTVSNAGFYNVNDDEYPELLRCLDLDDDLASQCGYEDPNKFEEPCKYGYKVVLAVETSGQNGMHWYRQDSNGLWSHKMGGEYITDKDSDGDFIIDPRYCAKDYNEDGYTEDTYRYIGCFEAIPWYTPVPSE